MTQNQTKKEQKKQARLLLFKKLDFLENQIKSNPERSNFEELLFSVAEAKFLAKQQAEVIRIAEVVCFCGKDTEKDKHFKNLLYSQIKKISEIDEMQENF